MEEKIVYCKICRAQGMPWQGDHDTTWHECHPVMARLRARLIQVSSAGFVVEDYVARRLLERLEELEEETHFGDC